eukprot:Nk52_evm26s242 gene=Nk52_evmTU26s242
MAVDGRIVKMDKDYSDIVDKRLPELEKQAKDGQTPQALESLMSLEKQTRVAGDAISTAKVLISIVKVLFKAGDWQQLMEQTVMLSKRRGQLKEATKRMVQEVVTYVDQTPSKEMKLKMIDTLITVTSGKIYVEIERARLTRKLASIKETDGDIAGAADTLQELQVETFGSMDKREKVEFILEQMRLCGLKKDFIKVQIISKKVSSRFFEKDQEQDLKLKYYKLLIPPSLHEKKHLEVCKFYWEIYNTPLVRDDELEALKALKEIINYLILAPFDNEQSDFFHRMKTDKNLEKIPEYKAIISVFSTFEITSWKSFETRFGAVLKSSTCFDHTEGGKYRYAELRKRVVELDMRVIAMYYSNILLKRIAELVDLKESEAEEFLSNLVVKKTFYAKYDRISGIVTFEKTRNPDTILNEWSNNVDELLKLVDKTTHLISKEVMVSNIR